MPVAIVAECVTETPVRREWRVSGDREQEMGRHGDIQGHPDEETTSGEEISTSVLYLIGGCKRGGGVAGSAVPFASTLPFAREPYLA